MVDRPARKRHEGRAGLADFGVALGVGIAHDGVGVGDIEIVADQRHAERRIQMIEEDGAHVGHAVAIGVAQQRDAVALAGVAARVAQDSTQPMMRSFGRLTEARPAPWIPPPARRRWAAHRASADAAARSPAPGFSFPAAPSASPPCSIRRWRQGASAGTGIAAAPADWDEGRSRPWDRRPGRRSRPAKIRPRTSAPASQRAL